MDILELEINTYCVECKKHFTQTFDPNEQLKCAACGSALCLTGFQCGEY